MRKEKVTNPRRGEVYFVNFEDDEDTTLAGGYPCIVVSPDEINQSHAIHTASIVPLTSTYRENFPFRVQVKSQEGRVSYAMTEQIMPIDKKDLLKKAGNLPSKYLYEILDMLQETFRR